MKVTPQSKSSKVHDGNRFTSCFSCNTCLESKDAPEIGGPLFLGNIDTASILFVASFHPHHRDSTNYGWMKYLLSQSEGGHSEALKAAFELEFFGSEQYNAVSAICQLKDGRNPFIDGNVLVTNTLKCFLDKTFLEGESLKNCGIWTMQVISLMKPKGIVFLGSSSLTQVLGGEMSAGISQFEIRKHGTFGPVLLLPDGELATSRSNLVKSQDMFEQFYEKVMK